jgi:hypothetical protein
MDPDKLPGARVIAPILWLVLLGGIAVWLFVTFHVAGLTPAKKIEENVVISLLKSELLTFLVTRRTSTQIVVEHNESDLLGEWRGVLWAKVSWRWGVDLNKLKAENMHRHGNSWVVDLPEPELLDFAIVPGSVGCLTKATLVPKVADFCRGGSIRQALEARLGVQAMKFAGENGMLPSRAEIVRQLNEAIKPLLRGTEATIVFQ